MRFGSVCSGIEAASVAWEPLGWKAAWLSEIEPFPSAVLKHHYPDVPNLGDMTTLPQRIASGEVEAPDLFCGGTPCQAFSVAGLRKSLDDARGNLSLTFCEIANEIDTRRIHDGLVPAIIFWENVPGVLNTKDNAFGCFLAGLAGESLPLLPAGGKWTNAGCVLGPQRAVAWRVLDAQYFGVAQRRRRVFVVASARNDFNPAEVLFEFEGVRRDTAPSREAGQRVAPTVTSGPPFSRSGNDRVEAEAIIPQPHSGNENILIGGVDYENNAHGADDPTGPLLKGSPTGGGRPLPAIITQPYAVANCLTQRMYKGINTTLDEGQTPVIAPVAFPANLSGTQCASAEDIIPSMGAKNPTAVAFQVGPQSGEFTDVAPTLDCRAKNGPIQNQLGAGVMQPAAFQQTADCLTAAYGTKWNGNASAINGSLFAGTAMQVRRLTPVECERLQGFPDGYTAIPWRKRPVEECPDGPRYKALGNSWAVPVVRWIGKRIQERV